MPVWEKLLVGALLAVAVPISLLVVGWWGSASLSLSRIYPLDDGTIAASAITGLLLGIVLVAWRLRGWVRGFYAFPLRLAIPVYLFWSAIATAWFMGLPFGTLALGAIAGAYMGRRAVYQGLRQPEGRGVAMATAAFCASVTALSALGIGLLALREPYTLAFARRALGTAAFLPDPIADVALVAAAVIGLFVLQFILTWYSARVAAGLIMVVDARPA